MITTSSADGVLKSYYLDAVAEQLNKTANPLLAAIEQTTSDVRGKDVVKAAVVGVHGGVGAGTEDGSLPAVGDGSYAKLTATLKNLYGRIEISDKAIRASSADDGAFVDLLNTEMEQLIRSSSFNFGRMLFGDGSGKLGTVSAVSGTTYTLDSAKNFAVGMIVDLFDADGTSVGEGRTVMGVDYANKKIVLSGATISAAANAAVYVQGSKGLEITGLGAIFSDSTTLYGLTRADHPWLNPVEVAVGGAITEAAVQKAIDLVEESAGSRVNFIVCSWGVRRALYKVLSAYRRIDTVELAGGAKAITFNGIPVVADRFCPSGTMYLLNTDDFRLHQLCDWQWLEGENGRILAQVPGKPVYTATLVKYAELLCSRPCGQAVLTGITEE